MFDSPRLGTKIGLFWISIADPSNPDRAWWLNYLAFLVFLTAARLLIFGE